MAGFNLITKLQDKLKTSKTMKKIHELSEQEILNLTTEEIDKMIKLRIAEEGIKFIDYPSEPKYFEVNKPNSKVYYCNLLGHKLSFTDMEEIIKVIDVLSNCKTICSIDSNYELPDGYKYFMKSKVENATWSNDDPFAIIPINAYTNAEYVKVKDMLNQNAKNKKEFESKVKEYASQKDSEKWIVDEIMDRVNEVVNKYQLLDNYIYRFKNDYMTLSDNNEEIAMNFMTKAYSLTKDQSDYILNNYKGSEKL